MKKIVSIEGMHCRSCEILIEDELKKIPGIKDIKANFRKNEVKFYSQQEPPNFLEIEKAISKAGYKIGYQEKPWVSKNLADYRDLLYALILLIILYFVIRNINFGQIKIENLAQPSSLIIVLLVGLTAGISTCMALVGGLVLGISARFSEKHPAANTLQKFRPHLFFNMGRIVSFFILGGVIGELGKSLKLSSPLLGILTIFVAIIMLVLGLQLIEIFPRITSASFTLPSSLAKFLGIKKRREKEYSHTNSVIVGALTFFLPCGFTQAMQLYALSTGQFLTGALIMSIFALGTTPGLLGIGGVTSIIEGSFAKKFYKFAGLLVIFLAIFNLRNGFNLTGFRGLNIFNREQSESVAASTDPNVKIENGVQIVRMTQSERGYSPNHFQVKKGIPVKWMVTSTSPYTCASALVSRQLNIDSFLKSGENIFNFTPEATGTIKFSCSMGMYRGEFQVVS